MSRYAPNLSCTGLALALFATAVVAETAGTSSVRDQIIAAGHAQGVAITPQISVNRGFPACSAPLTVTPANDRWTSVTLACPGATGWTRTIRTTAPISPHNPETGTRMAQPMVTAWVLVESLPRGTILQAADLTQTDLTAAGHTDLVQNSDTAIGRVLRSNLSAGQPLLGRHLAPDTAVKRDRPVSITIAAAPILIEAAGIALEDGQLGEDIRVRNTASDRIIHVTVTGPNKVSVQPNMR